MGTSQAAAFYLILKTSIKDEQEYTVSNLHIKSLGFAHSGTSGAEDRKETEEVKAVRCGTGRLLDAFSKCRVSLSWSRGLCFDIGLYVIADL